MPNENLPSGKNLLIKKFGSRNYSRRPVASANNFYPANPKHQPPAFGLQPSTPPRTFFTVIFSASFFPNCFIQSGRLVGAVVLRIAHRDMCLRFFPVVPALRPDGPGHFTVQINRAGVNPPWTAKKSFHVRIAGDIAF